MDNSELIERYKDELSQIIKRMQKDNIREEIIHFILDQEARNSEIRIIAKGELS